MNRTADKLEVLGLVPLLLVTVGPRLWKVTVGVIVPPGLVKLVVEEAGRS
jgi:hypothetical protein